MRDRRREKERKRERRRRNRANGPYVHIARRSGDAVEYLVGMTARGALCWHEQRYAQPLARLQAHGVLPIVRKHNPTAHIVELVVMTPREAKEAVARAIEAFMVKP